MEGTCITKLSGGSLGRSLACLGLACKGIMEEEGGYVHVWWDGSLEGLAINLEQA